MLISTLQGDEFIYILTTICTKVHSHWRWICIFLMDNASVPFNPATFNISIQWNLDFCYCSNSSLCFLYSRTFGAMLHIEHCLQIIIFLNMWHIHCSCFSVSVRRFVGYKLCRNPIASILKVSEVRHCRQRVQSCSVRQELSDPLYRISVATPKD